METIIAEAKDRNLIAHAIWKEFIPDTAEPTIAVRTVRPKRGSPQTVEVGDYQISISLLRKALVEANRLNFQLSEFTRIINSALPPPADARKF
jgi:hypothetical protein